ncbi:SWIM zinc finger family protein [Bacillus inaquosorum]|uniref:SWIM zinc finger family protein n=1 Tax=Bacillus inaquosorum TaxID=483913 RepID=UPI00227E1CF1|nr:SWIM zinc finger family protein [Bacillus inaquosorum]MCY8994685.1 SWIM zinc finger family protein [Bacillus inaquosorum]MCY9012991.1 SWIM zinc finger family protein [Bacillus inaquosorum]MCY9095378.1 SWIM zinc finger family protein [Bacillus inaquosorum]
MLQNMISKDDVLASAEQLKELLPYNEENVQLIKKALILYRQDSVYRLQAVSPTEVTAFVQDVVPVRVTLNLFVIVKSGCSCPSGRICRHMLAVFLYVYAMFERVGTFTEYWLEREKLEESKELVRRQFQEKVLPNEESLSSWLAFFDSEFSLWQARTPEGSQNMQGLYYGYLSALKKHAPNKPELKSLYQIHSAIAVWLRMFTLIEAGKLNPEQDFYSLNPYIEQLMDTIYSSIDKLKTYALSFALDPFLEKTPDVIRNLLLKEEIFQYERIRIFGEIWSALLSRPKWVAREQEILKKEAGRRFSPELQFGRLHLEFLQKNDDVIFAEADQFPPEALPYTFQWLSEITAKKDWKRLKTWYQRIEPIAMGYTKLDKPFKEIRDVIGELFLLLNAYVKQTNDQALFERYAAGCLPYTFTEYSHHLYEKKRYAEWIEIHSLVGFSINEMDKIMLKEIAASDPEALIPAYHREVAFFIDQKNRSSYKEAARYLKKLRTLYRKAKKLKVWERYIQQLSSHYKRLRALQEELQKGKLIDGES